MALRWAGGAVLASGAGLTGLAAFAGAFSAEESAAEEPLAAVAPTPTATPLPDLATHHGLTLKVEAARTDDAQTQLDIYLEGRPEIGRIFALESKAGPGPNLALVRVIDDTGTTYGVGTTESFGDGRRLRVHLGPVSANTPWLELIVPVVSFVAPQDEPASGGRPPTASSELEGPWRVRVDEITRTDVARYGLDLEPLALGPGTAVPFEVVHTASATLLGIRFEGRDDPDHGGFIPFPELRTLDGERVPLRNSGRPRNDSQVIYMSYEPTHGAVTLTIRPHIIIGLPANICANPGDEHCVSQEEIERLGPGIMAERAALEALLASQPEPTWTFTIP
jgi:hypothetical protein